MNPAADGAAVRAYEGFHWGRKARKLVKVRVAREPRELVKLGTLEAVTYSTTKGGHGFAHYEHEFGEGGRRKPTLAMDPRGRRLHVVGGGYSVEDRGIVG
jgi:hypothetical protein